MNRISCFIRSMIGTAATPGVCPVPLTRQQTARLLWPLASFVVPTVAIGFGLVIPRSCIAGINQLSVGFGATVLGACVTYLLGIRTARRI